MSEKTAQMILHLEDHRRAALIRKLSDVAAECAEVGLHKVSASIAGWIEDASLDSIRLALERQNKAYEDGHRAADLSTLADKDIRDA